MLNGEEDEREERELARWEQEYIGSWVGLREDASGRLAGINDPLTRRRVAQQIASTRIRRGLQRHVCVIVDISRSMNQTDLRPSRTRLALKSIELFIKEYFDQNPLSQLSFIACHSSIATKVTELSGRYYYPL